MRGDSSPKLELAATAVLVLGIIISGFIFWLVYRSEASTADYSEISDYKYVADESQDALKDGVLTNYEYDQLRELEKDREDEIAKGAAIKKIKDKISLNYNTRDSIIKAVIKMAESKRKLEREKKTAFAENEEITNANMEKGE